MTTTEEAERVKAALSRVQALARYLDKLAPGDQHYAKLISDAIEGNK